MKKFKKDEKGAVLVLVALFMTVVLGMLALVVDAGSLYLEKSRLQKGIDLAVLAGMQNLPDRPQAALDAATRVANENGLSGNELSITLQEGGTVFYGEGQRTVPLTFAKVLGFHEQVVQASAKAQVGSLAGVQGAVPLGAYGNRTFSFGTQVTLRVGSGGNDTGAFGALELSGQGASEYEKDLTEGYSGILSIGDIVETRSGTIANPTFRAIGERRKDCPYHQVGKIPTYMDHPDNCPLVVIIPIYKEVVPNDFTKVQIVGFGSFFIDSVGRANEGAPITGRFIRYSFSGEFTPEINPYGAYAYKLVE
ncbi:pilus assembly protein TadG-related protein [Evansella sp. AB-P1]|uniref:pilus assembly protein TadG-related protein n=1 Tax=Evansella sp. AB-P1 TaxID=3037653 RepID=UPI00241D4F45|nr:pilus assembly protein TadG-related protein [Evansella sp. AB-P1]MDG5788471.1 pilus assembly protein TadG-related protein [Evansella sp. AB-P1]